MSIHLPPTASQPEDRFQPPKFVRGRKQHVCCECGEVIFEGDEHELFSGKFAVDSEYWAEPPSRDDADSDGRVWGTWRTCNRCHHARRRLNELVPAEYRPKRTQLALMIERFLYTQLDKERWGAVMGAAKTRANVIRAFCNTYRTQGG